MSKDFESSLRKWIFDKECSAKRCRELYDESRGATKVVGVVGLLSSTSFTLLRYVISSINLYNVHSHKFEPLIEKWVTPPPTQQP